MNVLIVTPEQIYNEFSSGVQDISAIRDFMRMLYVRNAFGNKSGYLLLFGDGSFDYKHRVHHNSNFVPTYESAESLRLTASYVTDDFYGLLDEDEGMNNAGELDIGIGRFVVSNAAEAKMAVDKSIHYATKTPEVMGSWRNMITFMADDGDGNRHLKDAEYLSDFMKANYPVYNIDKIYLDAYPQVSTPAGQRAPEMNLAVNQRIEKGSLIMNYNGHGGEIGLGHERFLELADINSWKNYEQLPIFITATCEFSRYDDPSRISAGEQVFLN